MFEIQRKEGSNPRTVYYQREGTLPPSADQSSKLTSMCRLCMTTTGTEMKDIFAGGTASFAKKLVEVVQFEVTTTDGFPPRICHRCSLQLNSAYTFKLRCLDSHKKIADMIYRTRGVCKQEVKEERLVIAPAAQTAHARRPNIYTRNTTLPVTSTERLGAQLTIVDAGLVPVAPTTQSHKRAQTNSKRSGLKSARFQKVFPTSTVTREPETISTLGIPELNHDDSILRNVLTSSATLVDLPTEGCTLQEGMSEILGVSNSPVDLPNGSTVDFFGTSKPGECLVLNEIVYFVDQDVKPNINSLVPLTATKDRPFSFVEVKEETTETFAEEPIPPLDSSIEVKFSPPLVDHDYCTVSQPYEPEPTLSLQPIESLDSAAVRRKPRKNDLTRFKTCEDLAGMSHYMKSPGFRKLLKIPGEEKEKPRKAAAKSKVALEGENLASVSESIEATVRESREWAERSPGLDVVLAEFVSIGVDGLGLLEGVEDISDVRPEVIADLDLSLFSSEEFAGMEDEVGVAPKAEKRRDKRKRTERKRRRTEGETSAKKVRVRKERVKKERVKKERVKKKRVRNEGARKKRVRKPRPRAEPKTHTCVHCEATFDKFLYLDTHLRYHCGPNKRDITCNLCGETFKLIYKLNAHLSDAHPGGLNFKCDRCDRAFRTHPSLLQHINRRHTRERMFLCSVCGKMFALATQLRTHHRAVHSGDRPHGCNVCGKTFSVLNLLRSHEKTHSDTTYFNCGHCNKNFKMKQTLVHHIYAHIGRKPFRCSYCRKRFCNSSDLKKHLRVHTGEHPYKCGACGKAFTQRWYLRKHPCPERDRLEELASQPGNAESQSTNEGSSSQRNNEVHSTNEGISSQPFNEEDISSQPSNEEGLSSQTTNEESLLSQLTNEEVLSLQFINEEGLSLQASNEEALSLQLINEEGFSSQSCNEEDLSSQSTNDENLLSQPQ